MSTATLALASPEQAMAAVRMAQVRLALRTKHSDIRAWRSVARQDQLPPEGEWRVWYVLGGRGAGKTWTSAHTFAEWCVDHPGEYGIVAPTYADARDVCIEGESGLLRAFGTTRSQVERGESRYVESWNRSQGEMRLRNGSVLYADGADDGATRIQGHNLSGCWASEIGLWRRWRVAWEESIRYAVRRGLARIVADGTPKRGHGLVHLLASDETVPKRRLRTMDNAANLNPLLVEEWKRLYGGTALGRQELEGEVLEDVPGAAWQRAWIDEHRIPPDRAAEWLERHKAELIRVVVGVDPAITSSEGADETGIVAVASYLHPADGHEDRKHEHYVVLEDGTLKATPSVWARRAVTLYERLSGDAIVGEVNKGGEMIEQIVRQVNPSVAFRAVRATRGKVTRAEPIAALYEQGKVHHVGAFPELEDQQCSYVPGESGSPDRMDALVWALTDLAIRDEPGLLGLYRGAVGRREEEARKERPA